MLLDAWIWRQKGKPYDKDALPSSEGKVLLPLLQDMLSDPWFASAGAESTGISITLAGAAWPIIRATQGGCTGYA